MTTIADLLKEQAMQQGMQQGVQQGMIQDAREAILDILEMRFDILPESIVKEISNIIDPSILKMLRRKAVKTNSLDEFGQIIKLTKK